MFQSTHPHGVRLVGPRLLWPYLQFQSTHPHGVRLSPSLVRIDVKKFQSTHPHGVRLGSEGRQGLHQRQFQSTHPHGVRPSPDGGFKLNNTLVSIHAPTRGATTTLVVVLCIFILGVSIHAPTRGATLEERHIDAKVESFQSTHPHGVRQHTNNTYDPMTSVSIHAPTRGATPDSVYGGRNGGWFQSTHPHGVRHMGVIQADENGCFNPRTHTGCDCHLPEYLRGEYVSIHAPTRGATAPLGGNVWCRFVSIHAPTRGATLIGGIYGSVDIGFQSTHPHGVRRRQTNIVKIQYQCFNPRTHTGCDSVQSYIL